MDPATQIDLAPLAAERGLPTLERLLAGRLAPRKPSPHGPWPTELPALLAAARPRRFDAAGARLLLERLGPLERGLAAYDLLSQCLFTDAERPLVDELQREAGRVAALLPSARWPLSEPALRLPAAELERLIVELSAGGAPFEATNPLALAPLWSALQGTPPSEARDLLCESARMIATELHYAHLSTWASVALALLVRLGGHRRAAVDLIEVGGSMPRLAGAHAGIDALLTATGQPAAVRGYFEGRLFGYGAPQSVREGTIARLRAALGELVGGADVDAAVTFRGPETVGRAAPLVDQEAIDLATLALAHQELLAGLGTRPVSQLIDVGTRRPGWRFSARVRLGHLVARTGPDAPLELLAKEEQLFYRMFGPHYASQQSYVRLMTPGSDVWKRSQLMALEQLQWNLSSADAWMTLGFHLLSRGGSDEDRRSLVDEHFAAVDRQLAGIPR